MNCYDIKEYFKYCIVNTIMYIQFPRNKPRQQILF